jgi:hypothetical protein
MKSGKPKKAPKVKSPKPVNANYMREADSGIRKTPIKRKK